MRYITRNDDDNKYITSDNMSRIEWSWHALSTNKMLNGRLLVSCIIDQRMGADELARTCGIYCL